MNIRRTKKFFEKNGIIALKADLDKNNSEVSQLLVELGNTGRAIPYYAIFAPGKEPVHFGMTNGITLSSDKVINEIEKLLPAGSESGQVASTAKAELTPAVNH